VQFRGSGTASEGRADNNMNAVARVAKSTLRKFISLDPFRIFEQNKQTRGREWVGKAVAGPSRVRSCLETSCTIMRKR